MDRWIDGWMDRWMDGWVDGWMDGWMDGWVDGWMDGWMDEWILFVLIVVIGLKNAENKLLRISFRSNNTVLHHK
jgi:hypothetical protein